MKAIHLVSNDSSLGPAYDVALTKDADIGSLMAWLRRIDWSPSKARSLAGVGLMQVGRITLDMADGSARTFGLSGGSIIVDGRGQWEWPADTDRLPEIARRAGAEVVERR